MTKSEFRALLWDTYAELCKQENKYTRGFVTNNPALAADRWRNNKMIRESFDRFAVAVDRKLK